MKILVISDSHGNLKSLEHAIGFARAAHLDAIIHCGDWDTLQAVKVITKSGLSVYGVLGNADIDPLVTSKLSEACFSLPLEMKSANIHFSKDFLEFETGKRKIGVCHFPPARNVRAVAAGGQKLKDAIKSGEYDVLFHGHTHRKKDEMHGKTRVVNPGALSRTATPSFAVYDTETNTVEFVDIAV